MSPSQIFLIFAAFVVLYGVFRPGRPSGAEDVTVQLSGEYTVRIGHKKTHPALAEYDREVAVLRQGKDLGTLSYPKDSGGGLPMQIRYYGNSKREVVRLTDSLYDRLIDLPTGRFVADETPPEGKEFSLAIREGELPPLKRAFEITRNMEVSEKVH
jgi:hypothetical protein